MSETSVVMKINLRDGEVDTPEAASAFKEELSRVAGEIRSAAAAGEKVKPLWDVTLPGGGSLMGAILEGEFLAGFNHHVAEFFGAGPGEAEAMGFVAGFVGRELELECGRDVEVFNYCVLATNLYLESNQRLKSALDPVADVSLFHP